MRLLILAFTFLACIQQVAAHVTDFSRAMEGHYADYTAHTAAHVKTEVGYTDATSQLFGQVGKCKIENRTPTKEEWQAVAKITAQDLARVISTKQTVEADQSKWSSYNENQIVMVISLWNVYDKLMKTTHLKTVQTRVGSDFDRLISGAQTLSGYVSEFFKKKREDTLKAEAEKTVQEGGLAFYRDRQDRIFMHVKMPHIELNQNTKTTHSFLLSPTKETPVYLGSYADFNKKSEHKLCWQTILGKQFFGKKELAKRWIYYFAPEGGKYGSRNTATLAQLEDGIMLFGKRDDVSASKGHIKAFRATVMNSEGKAVEVLFYALETPQEIIDGVDISKANGDEATENQLRRQAALAWYKKELTRNGSGTVVLLNHNDTMELSGHGHDDEPRFE